MLLTILVVSDESSLHFGQRTIKFIESQLCILRNWEGEYELLNITLSDKELIEITGNISTAKKLLSVNGRFADCKGKYIWVLPCFVGIENNPKIFEMLFQALSLGVKAVLMISNDGNPVQAKIELYNSYIDIMPISQIFDEHRYICTKEFLEECFDGEKSFGITLEGLSYKVIQGGGDLYAKIPCSLPVLPGLVSNALYRLMLDYYSGNRVWQRDVLILPKAFFVEFKLEFFSLHDLKLTELEIVKHFVYSSCSFFENYSDLFFSENISMNSKREAFFLGNEVMQQLLQISNLCKDLNSLVLIIEKLCFFFNYWIKTSAEPISSENILNPEKKKGVFDGVWWLGKELKDDFNFLGKQQMIIIINELRAVNTAL